MDSKEIIALSVTAVVAFLFGNKGVFQKILDFVLGQKKEKEISIKEQITQLKEQISKKDMQIEELHDIADHFKNSCVDLKLELVQTNTHIVTLLAYLETLMPDGVHPFISQMAKEIRKNINKEDAK